MHTLSLQKRETQRVQPPGAGDSGCSAVRETDKVSSLLGFFCLVTETHNDKLTTNAREENYRKTIFSMETVFVLISGE